MREDNFNNGIQRIKANYTDRESNPIIENFYFSHYAKSERELKYLEILRREEREFDNLKILEIGAGGGDNLLYFHRLGVSWNNIYANELLDNRVEILKKRLLSINIYAGDVLDLDFERYFDIVFQSTVFSSILDFDFRRAVAIKMMGMIKKEGFILWYDFKFDNPKNKNVKGVTKKEVKFLFREAKSFTFYNVTLAPPIGRVVGKWYQLVNFLFPFLRTHFICLIKM